MTIFIGIDPGVNGALVALDESKVEICRGDLQAQDVWGWLCLQSIKGDCFAMIEQQMPRPTRWQDKVTRQWVQSVLASTCILYGNYMQLKGLLIASEIPHEDCPAKRWQEGLHIPSKEKGEKDGKWKSRLRKMATQLFPREHVTLVNCDALLLAEFCRRRQEGKL